MGTLSSQVSQEGLWRVVETGKDGGQTGITEVAGNGLTDHAPEIGGEREIASFVEL